VLKERTYGQIKGDDNKVYPAYRRKISEQYGPKEDPLKIEFWDADPQFLEGYEQGVTANTLARYYSRMAEHLNNGQKGLYGSYTAAVGKTYLDMRADMPETIRQALSYSDPEGSFFNKVVRASIEASLILIFQAF